MYSKNSDQPMTPKDIADWVRDINCRKNDPAAAHEEEDIMREDVLRAIRDGRATDPVGCAREALKSSELNFSRWYA